ncbi:MAG: insulinase family protein [Desulfobacterales bacterium]|nr:insulinase family protein [Desulfobacterales bacterium]
MEDGGRSENESNNGISHFIEHMLFKGYPARRSAYDIAREIDAVGGAINAFTGKEYTCLYARVLKKDTDIALDILSDMYRNPLFLEDDLEKERYVIAQEIKMVEDSPEEYIYEMFNASYFKGHSLGLPILGKQENVENFTKDELTGSFSRTLRPMQCDHYCIRQD